MKIHIDEIPADGLEIAVDTKSDAWWSVVAHEAFAELLPETALADAELSVTRSENTITVAGEVTASLRPRCDRCLEPFEWNFSLSLQQYLIPAAAQPERHDGAEEVELTEADLELDTYQGKVIRLDDILREQLVLALPYQQSCRPDCRGLCDHCGINLNQASCSCHEEHRDSPFASLKSAPVEKA